MKVFLILIFSLLFLISCQSISPGAKQNYQKAQSSWQEGDKDTAILLMKNAIKISPKYYEAHIKLGQFYSEIGEYDKAVLQFSKGSNLEPAKAKPLVLTGEAYIEKIRFWEAKENYDIYLKAQHKFSKALNLGKISKNLKFRAILGKGICLLKRTLKEDARNYLTQALKLDPKNEKSIFFNGVLKEKEIGPNKFSLEAYQKILISNPKHLEALKQLGDLFKYVGYKEKAFSYYKKFVSLGGKSNDIKEWVEKYKPSVVDKKTKKEKEVVMICPECGRIGKKGQKICEFDGMTLVPQKKVSHVKE